MPRLDSVRRPLITLSLCLIASLIIFWPGIMSPDAFNQYSSVRSGTYTDHHPPMMSFIWHYLDMFYTGPGLILLLHLSMLYASMAVFILTFKDSKFKWWFVVFPLIPNILSYTPLIVKDVGFAYSYLLSGSILSYMMINKLEKFKYPLLILVLMLLFYGTAVKYQARFVLIFLTLGLGFCLEYKFDKRALLSGVVLYVVLLQAMFSFNSYLVPDTQKSHAWQLVKLYDLAAISIDLDRPLFPEFVKHNPDFDFNKLKEFFAERTVDPLVFPANSVLKAGINEKQRSELLHYWRTTVRQHPLLYLQSRFGLWSHNFTNVPSGCHNPAYFFKDTILGPWLNSPKVYVTVDLMFNIFNVCLQFIWLLPFLVFYTYLSFSKINKSSYAAPLLMFSAISITFLGILFFFSMTATSRYVFICTCLVHISHGFAYKCWKAR